MLLLHMVHERVHGGAGLLVGGPDGRFDGLEEAWVHLAGRRIGGLLD